MPTRQSARRPFLAGLWPGTDPRMSGLGAASVFLLAFAVAVMRLGPTLGLDTVYAEDGRVFLTDEHAGEVDVLLLRPYAGYAHLLPRVFVGMVSVVPMDRAAVALTVSAALVQATAAWVGYVVVRAHARSVGPALLVAAAVAMVPVGLEVVLNVANAQWFLLFAGISVQFWTPRGASARSLQVVLAVVLVLSSPFGFVVIGVVALRALLRRTVGDLVSVLSLVAAGLLQLWVMTHSGVDRIGSSSGRAAVLWGYVSRVAGDAVLGVGRFGEHEQSASAVEGVVVLAVFGVLVLVLAARRGGRPVLAVLAFLALSVATFLPPVLLTPQQTANPEHAGRYYVAPALFWLVAVALVLPVAEAGDERRWVTRGISAVISAVVVVGMVSSYHVAQRVRADAPSWSAEVDRARERCRTLVPEATVEVPIHPKGWVVIVPCRSLGAEDPVGTRARAPQAAAPGTWLRAPS